MLARLDTYTLPLAHLMEVGPPSDDDYLGIARIAQVRCQLPLSRPVPAHVEEYLDDDEDYDNSDEEKTNNNTLFNPQITRFFLFFILKLFKSHLF